MTVREQSTDTLLRWADDMVWAGRGFLNKQARRGWKAKLGAVILVLEERGVDVTKWKETKNAY